MAALMQRFMRTERLRVLVLSIGVALWMLMLMVVYREVGSDILGPELDNAIGQAFDIRRVVDPDLVLGQLLGMAYTHPMFLIIISAIVVTLGVRSCAGELEAGTLELTLARPVSRRRYLLSYMLFLNLATLLLIVVAAAAAWAFSGALDVLGSVHADRLSQVSLNAFLMFSGFGAICTLLSTLVSSRSAATFSSVGVIVAMYFLTLFSRVWEPVEPLGQLSLFTYLDATPIMFGEGLDMPNVAVLAAVVIVANAIALLRFERRDLV